MDSFRINCSHFHFIVLGDCKILNWNTFWNMHEYRFLHGVRGGAVGYATSPKVAGSIPDGIIGIFH